MTISKLEMGKKGKGKESFQSLPLETFNNLLLGFVSRGTFQVNFENVSIKKFPQAAFCGQEKWLYKVSEFFFLPKLSGRV